MDELDVIIAVIEAYMEHHPYRLDNGISPYQLALDQARRAIALRDGSDDDIRMPFIVERLRTIREYNDLD